MPRLICPEEGCGAPLRYRGSTKTLVAYISIGEGPRCAGGHDDNCVVHGFTCSNGHVHKYSPINKCHLCDWTGKKSCFCSTKTDGHPEWSHFRGE